MNLDLRLRAVLEWARRSSNNEIIESYRPKTVKRIKKPTRRYLPHAKYVCSPSRRRQSSFRGGSSFRDRLKRVRVWLENSNSAKAVLSFFRRSERRRYG